METETLFYVCLFFFKVKFGLTTLYTTSRHEACSSGCFCSYIFMFSGGVVCSMPPSSYTEACHVTYMYIYRLHMYLCQCVNVWTRTPAPATVFCYKSSNGGRGQGRERTGYHDTRKAEQNMFNLLSPTATHYTERAGPSGASAHSNLIRHTTCTQTEQFPVDSRRGCQAREEGHHSRDGCPEEGWTPGVVAWLGAVVTAVLSGHQIQQMNRLTEGHTK